MHLDLKTMPQLGLRAPAAAQVLVVSLVRLFRTLEQVVLEEAMSDFAEVAFSAALS